MPYDNVVGVDVASKKLDCFDSKSQKHTTIENSKEKTKVLAEQLKARAERILVVMEATGGYENLLVEALHNEDVDCAVVNPLRIRQFPKACGKLEKNDVIDAKVIAEFGSYVQPALKGKVSPQRKNLRNLVHRRDQILSQSMAERKRLKQTEDATIREFIQNAIEFYKRQLKQIDSQINKPWRVAKSSPNSRTS